MCILVAGILLRGAYLVEVSGTPEFSHPIYDPEYNAYWARSLATGDWTVPPGMPDPEIRTTPHGRPPGYPWFLAAVYVLFGVNDYAPRIVQMLLGLANALLLFVIGKRLFGPAAGFLSGMFMALYWVFPYFEAVLSYPSVAIFVLLLMILALMRWYEEQKPAWLAAAGGLLGTFALFRPNALLLAPLLFAWVGGVLWKGGVPWKRAAATLIVFTVSCAGVLVPAFVRNYVVARDVVFLSSYGGINLYVGNHPRASLVEPRIPELKELAGIENWSCFDYPSIVRGIAAAQGREAITFSEANRYFYRKAFDAILEDPATFLRNLGRKTLLFFGPREITNDTVMEYDKRFSRVLGPMPGFSWVLSFFGLGLFLFLLNAFRVPRGTRIRERNFGIVLLCIFCVYCASVILYFVAGRYRVPVIPLMLLFASYGIVALARAFREGRWRVGLAGLVVLACVAPLASRNLSGYEPSLGTWHLRRAMAFTAAGEEGKAREEYLRALEYGADSSVIYANLGRLHFDNNEIEQGIDMYKRGLDRNPDDAIIRNNLGYELYKRGRIDEAVEHLEAAVRVNPRFMLARMNLGNALADRGDTDAALEQFQEAMKLDPREPAAPYNVARMLFARGDTDGAIAHYEKVLEMAPDHVQALNNLGYCHESRGEFDRAIVLYRRAVTADPAFTLAYMNLGNVLLQVQRYGEAADAYSRVLEQGPSNVPILCNLGRAYMGLGEWDRAFSCFGRAVELDAGHVASWYHMGLAYLERGETAKAVESLEKALTLAPDDVSIQSSLNTARSIGEKAGGSPGGT